MFVKNRKHHPGGNKVKKKILYHLRNLAKMTVQNVVLPIAHKIAKRKFKGEKTLYVFADAHHVDMPFSLEAMYHYVKSLGIEPVCHFYDYTHEGSLKSLKHAISFMDLLVRAKYVFICDTFAPVSAGEHEKGTKIVQLCHFAGPIKKLGYVTEDDVPTYYKGNVFKNYDLVSVSSEMYVPLIAEAMRQEDGVVQALGVSRSDVYYDEAWIFSCKEEFYKQFPDAHDKKILLWAPTFRGKASSPDALDNETFLNLQEKLGDEWLVLIKHHPHDDAVAKNPKYRSNCTIPSERLLPVIDFLITDYSALVSDFLLYERPFILYAPDLDDYEKTRGFFLDYRSITKNMTKDAKNLDVMIKKVYQQWLDGDHEEIRQTRERLMSACDGNATKRIIEYLQP